jgi:hypothetical protein
VALSRWDDDTAPSMEGRLAGDDWTFYSHSQDAWAFVAGGLPAIDPLGASVGGHRTKAASVLGISRKVLWEKLKDYGIE